MNANRAEQQAFSEWQAARRRPAAATGRLTRAHNSADSTRIVAAADAVVRARAEESAALEKWEDANAAASPADPLRGPMARLDATLALLEEKLARVDPEIREQ